MSTKSRLSRRTILQRILAVFSDMGPKLPRNPIFKHEDLLSDMMLQGRGPMLAWGAVLNYHDLADIRAS